MIPRHRPALTGALAVAGALALPAAAQAARPLVTTGGATKVAFSSAHLTGSVGARGKATVFFFQYGRTIAYGTQTAEAPAGHATGRTGVGADVLGLEPTRLYHYRLVARNKDGTTLGKDRTFRAKKQPLGFLLTATPNPVPFGDDFAVTGALGGTGAGGRAVALQGRGFPYSGPWTPLGNAQVTAPDGAFSFSVLNAGGNTQYRVVTTSSPVVESAIVPVGVAVRVSTHVNRTRVRRGGACASRGRSPREGRRALRRPAPGPQGPVGDGGRRRLAQRERDLLALLQALQGPAHEPLPDLRQRRRRHEPVGRRADDPHPRPPLAAVGPARVPPLGSRRTPTSAAGDELVQRPSAQDGAGSSATTSRSRSACSSRTLTSTHRSRRDPPAGGPPATRVSAQPPRSFSPWSSTAGGPRRAPRPRRRHPRRRTCRGPRR